MNELFKWGLILGGGYLAYNWFVNSQSGQVAPGPGSLTPSGGGADQTAGTPAQLCAAAAKTISDAMASNAARDWDGLRAFRDLTLKQNPSCSLPTIVVPGPAAYVAPVGNPPAPNLLTDKPLIGGIPGFSPAGAIGLSGRNYVRVRTR